MKKTIIILAMLAFAAPSWALTPFEDDPEPITPKRTVKLFNGRNYKGWDLYMRPDDFADPAEQVFTVKDGAMHVTGKGFGGCTTKKAYKNYHLKMEFRYIGDGYKSRAGKTADGGLLYHCTGPEGAYSGIWHLSFECNIIQGRCADLIVVGNKNKFPGVLEAKSYVDENQNYCAEGGKLVHLKDGGRVNAFNCDPSWQDVEAQPVVSPEKPYGEWNTLELICDGDTAEYILNGVSMLKLFDLKPASGRIQLQSECHGIEYRNITISPLK